jgi:hypothetical protein
MRSFYAYSLVKMHLHHSSKIKIKSHKEVTKHQKSMFFFISLLVDGRIQIRIRTYKLRIRRWIEEAQKHTDPADPDPDPDPDPEYYLKLFIFVFRKYFLHAPFSPEFLKHTC